MLIESLFTRAEFNYSNFQANEINRWKFLEEMSEDEAKNVGFFIRSPTPVVTLTICYVIFVKLIGPWVMNLMEPFSLKNLIRFYNLVMVILAGALLYHLYDAVESLESMFDADKMFTFSDGSATKVYQMANFILLVRISEYLDTIFFTLRKKQNQVTFLHVFHHAFVPIYAYWILRTAPCRCNVFIIIINSFVHVIMYFYYFLATFQERPSASATSGGKAIKSRDGIVMFIVKKLLLFKRYITQLQILQFIALGIYSLSVLFRTNRCGIPWTYILANFFLAFGFLSLFLHFYFKSYQKVTRTDKQKSS